MFCACGTASCCAIRLCGLFRLVMDDEHDGVNPAVTPVRLSQRPDADGTEVPIMAVETLDPSCILTADTGVILLSDDGKTEVRNLIGENPDA
jgi:hypothetical protein